MPGARDGQLKINRGGDNPPWTLLIWDDELGDYRDLRGADGAPGPTGPTGPMRLTTVGGVELAVWDWQGRLVLDRSGQLIMMGG